MSLAAVSTRTPATSATVKVVVVDDSAVVRGLTRRFLEESPNIEVVVTASNGKNAIEAVAKYDPDVVVLDIEMPVMDGLTAIPLILAEKPSVMHEIVRTTEVASNAIMESAEAITNAMPDNTDGDFRKIVQASCQNIFESCAFQDLTGQRISKVMSTLQLIDEHLETLQALLGDEFEDSEAVAPSEGEADLLSGPALEGEGNSQDDVDKLFDNM
ncbi:MAG: protein phosphatase CheZ [Alphaproteobacteria bacterium]|nr:protein phosphatase CheZ [Alphaproteobacteria bacterium]